MEQVEVATIWKRPISVEILNSFEENAMPSYVGIEITEVGG